MKNLFGIFMVAAMMVGCTNDNEPQALNQDVTGENLSYISVNLVSGNPTSRADAPIFENGISPEENAVNTIDFYFFGNDGKKFIVNDAKTNSVRLTESTLKPNETQGQNIEANTTAQVIIKRLYGGYPAKMVVVVNSPEATMDVESIDQLAKLVGEYGVYSNGFLMSTSVFMEGDQLMNYTPLTKANVAETEELAKAAPVQAYVERTLAKVRVNQAEPKFDTGTTITGLDGNELKVFAKLQGWQVTGQLQNASNKPECYLLKVLNPGQWKADSKFGMTNWNDAANHRSYWAESPASLKFEYQWDKGDFNLNFTPKTNFGYYYENTDSTRHTELIVNARFYDEKDNEVFPAKWLGATMTVQGVKQQMANMLIAEGIYIKASETTDQNGVVTIDKDPIPTEWISFQQGANQYEVHALISSDTELVVKTQTTSGVPDDLVILKPEQTPTTAPEVKDKINQALAKFQPAYIWDDGGYYHMNIKHLGTAKSTTEFGLVRNHVYDYNITKVQGLGTPLPEGATEIIIPQDPPTIDSYIAAELHILSWRLVKQDIELGTPDNK